MAKIYEYIDSPSFMEPMMPSEGDHMLEDLVAELFKKSSTLTGRICPDIVESVGNLVRSMNCYYSNLIEGHNTHPRDIERALANDYSDNQVKRTLQLEATAHIKVQEMIDLGEAPVDLVSINTISWIHKEFFQRLPEELLWATNPDTGSRIRVEAGTFRNSEVKVGHHVPPLATSLPAFLKRFAEAYNPNKLSQVKQVIAVAASHHRMLWIHPFYDGNGRVTRLFSHAYLHHIGIGNSLWSVSRGLAHEATKYKTLLMQADQPRQGDLDGRRNLTQKGLVEFCVFFLSVCIDQIEYMSSILSPNKLLQRIEIYVEEEVQAKRLPNGSFSLLREAALAGSFDRGKATSITGYKERQARTVLTALIKEGLLASDSPKGLIKLAFPISVVERYFPKLYPGL